MKGLPRIQRIALIAFGFLAACVPARAQTTNVFVSVFRPTNAIPINDSLTYTVFVTNTAGIALHNVFVTNAFSSSVEFTGATNNHSGSLSTNGNALTFYSFQILGGGTDIGRMSLTVRALAEGSLTNTVTVTADELIANIVVQVVNEVTNVPGAPADLAVTMAVPTAPVYVNDRMTYSLLVSNLGPSTATNVFLTNTLPAGFTFKTASPPQQSFSAQTLRFKLGNVANQAATTFKVTVQANSAGTNGLAASVAATDTTDPDLSNNTVASNVVVSDFLTNQLVVVTNDATQTFNPQIGLMEQGILLSNASPGSVPSVRVMVSGLGSTNWLFNAVGTNNGNPFVEYAATLDTNASVVLLLQFRVPSHAPFNLLNSNLVARGIAAVDLTPPANLRVPGNAAAFSRIIRVGSRMLMEIPSTYGRTYVVVYSTDAGFSDAKVARPSIVAPANWTYWYDYGPPATISAPMNSASRFYRIYQVPP